MSRQIQSLLLDCISKEGTEWSLIVEHIKANRQVKNWMIVRNNLQGLINAGIVQRFPSVQKEIYQLV